MKEHILVVDDEPQIRELLSLYLARHGYRVSTTGNSDETVQLVRQTPVDLVVLDIGLAEEDGLNLLVRLKSQSPNLRVIMLTGMGFVEDLLQEASQKGADGYVSKVMPLDELLTAIERSLQSTTKPAELSC
jgi:two-component system OmpR family response regulator